jgi:signal transduction histidine kinase
VCLERGRDNAHTVEELQAVVDRAIVGLDQSLSIITALLRIAELEQSQRVAGFGAVALANIAHEVGDLYEPIAEDKGIALVVRADTELTVYGDRDLLLEAAANLVDNAVKFTPSGGRVELAVVRRGHENILRISDSGPGIHEDEHDAVMKRFYRSDKSRHTPGVGLGLSLVAAIVKLHGFNLAISSGPNCVVEISGPEWIASAQDSKAVASGTDARVGSYGRTDARPVSSAPVLISSGFEKN